MRRSWLLALFLLPACEPEPCPKDTVLGPAQTPCVCEGAVVEALDCGNLVCTDYGLSGTTLADTGCTTTTTTDTTP